MEIEEKDRLVEILFFLYFNEKSEKMLAKTEFWSTIKNICELYNINNLAISKAIRTLTAKENIPSDFEIYYLLAYKMGLSVRPIRKVSKIYWQRQVEFKNLIAANNKPIIKRRITDVVIKKNIRDFLLALYNILGVFSSIDIKLLEEIL